MVFDAATSAAIGDFCYQQRLAYNSAVDHMLSHPSASRYDLFKELTKRKREDEQRHPGDRKWRSPLSVLRPRADQGEGGDVGVPEVSAAAG